MKLFNKNKLSKQEKLLSELKACMKEYNKLQPKKPRIQNKLVKEYLEYEFKTHPHYYPLVDGIDVGYYNVKGLKEVEEALTFYAWDFMKFRMEVEKKQVLQKRINELKTSLGINENSI